MFIEMEQVNALKLEKLFWNFKEYFKMNFELQCDTLKEIFKFNFLFIARKNTFFHFVHRFKKIFI